MKQCGHQNKAEDVSLAVIYGKCCRNIGSISSSSSSSSVIIRLPNHPRVCPVTVQPPLAEPETSFCITITIITIDKAQPVS